MSIGKQANTNIDIVIYRLNKNKRIYQITD